MNANLKKTGPFKKDLERSKNNYVTWRSNIDIFVHQYALQTINRELNAWQKLCILRSKNKYSPAKTFIDDLKTFIESIFQIYMYHHNNQPIHRSRAGDDLHSFNKTLYYLDHVRRNPLEGLTTVFKSSVSDHLKYDIEKWSKIYMEDETFAELSNMVEHVTFCKEIQKLIEALYILCAAYSYNTKFDNLLLNCSYLHLNKKEQNNPYIVLRNFTKIIPYSYAVAEIWEITNAAIINTRNKNINTNNILAYFEMFLSIIEAPYLITSENQALLNTIKILPVKC